MSDTMNVHRRQFRRCLLASASAIAMMGGVGDTGHAIAADDGDRPLVWIELGWHYEQISGRDDVFAPPFTTSMPRPDFETVSPLAVQAISLFSYGGDGKISFQPDDSDWIFSAAVRYGRAGDRKHIHEQTANSVKQCHFFGTVYNPCYQSKPRNMDAYATSSETHAIVDFNVARDVGLGLLGSGSTSTFGFGVRYAQINSRSTTGIDTIPDFYFPYENILKYTIHHGHFSAAGSAERSFRGIGPSISWDGDAALLGNTKDGEITFDWGANAAFLFGRQRAQVQHQTAGYFYKTNLVHKYKGLASQYQHAANPNRSRSVVVPNLGGFAGLSFRYSDAKLSLGYRADFFFGAIDGGINVAKKENRGFYGPFATISVGIGG